MGLEADTPEKWKQHVDLLQVSDKDLVKKLLTSNQKIRLLFNNFLTRSLSVSRIQWACFCHFFGVSASNPMQIWPVLTEISKKVLPESSGFDKYPPFLIL